MIVRMIPAAVEWLPEDRVRAEAEASGRSLLDYLADARAEDRYLTARREHRDGRWVSAYAFSTAPA